MSARPFSCSRCRTDQRNAHSPSMASLAEFVNGGAKQTLDSRQATPSQQTLQLRRIP